MSSPATKVEISLMSSNPPAALVPDISDISFTMDTLYLKCPFFISGTPKDRSVDVEDTIGFLVIIIISSFLLIQSQFG